MKANKPSVAVAVFIFNKSGEVLLGKADKWSGNWSVIGGHLEFGEKMVDAVRRETKEETGLDIYDISLIGAQENIFPKDYHKKTHFIMLDFACKTKRTNVVPNDEIQEYKWLSVRNALKLSLTKNTRAFLENYNKNKK